MRSEDFGKSWVKRELGNKGYDKDRYIQIQGSEAGDKESKEGSARGKSILGPQRQALNPMGLLGPGLSPTACPRASPVVNVIQ